MMKIGRWAILGLVVACSSAEQNGNGALLDAETTEAEQDLVGGTVVAEVALSQTHRVRFIELDGGGVVLDESGAEHDFDLRIEDGALDNLTFSEQFQALQARAGRTGATPAKLVEAEARANALKRPQNLPPPPAEPGRLDAASENLDAKYINKTTDAYDWKYSVCSSNYFDANYCNTNVTGVMQGATMSTMQWESYCKAASEIAGAMHWTQSWNGSSWGAKLETPVAARTWRRVTDSTITVRRSGCEGQSPQPLVHYNVRYRFAPSTLSLGYYYPNDRSRDIDNDQQGVTNDGNNWYFTNAKAAWYNAGKIRYSNIWKIPLGTNVGTEIPPVLSGNPWHDTYDHFGGLTYVNHEKVIAVALEKTGGGNRGAIGFFNTDLQYIGYALLPEARTSTGTLLLSDQAASMPWVAYNPKDKLLYSSSFDPGYLHKYRIESIWPPTLSYQGYVSIKTTAGSSTSMRRVQGGAFSPSGKLYLAEEASEEDLTMGNIAVLDPWTGRIHDRTYVPRDDDDAYGPDEFASPTVWDLDADTRDSDIRGQIHLPVIENDASNDNFFFRHLRAKTIGSL